MGSRRSAGPARRSAEVAGSARGAVDTGSFVLAEERGAMIWGGAPEDAPYQDPVYEPFWAAAREHRLVVPRCVNCNTYRFPPSPFCYVCRTQDIEWVEQTGHGTLYSFTIAWHPILPDVSDSVPYVPAVVELPNTGGVRIIGNLFDLES